MAATLLEYHGSPRYHPTPHELGGRPNLSIRKIVNGKHERNNSLRAGPPGSQVMALGDGGVFSPRGAPPTTGCRGQFHPNPGPFFSFNAGGGPARGKSEGKDPPARRGSARAA